MARSVFGPTLTAIAVAWARALYTEMPPPLGIVDDPYASQLIPGPLAVLARLAGSGSQRTSRLMQSAIGRLSAGMSTNIALRTAIIDEAVRRAIFRGAGQMVLLGSGLDARAWRMSELRPIDVFELDRGASHRYKRRLIGERRYAQGRHVLADIDFERQTIRDVLLGAGFDTNRPTVWVWEGVAVYLTLEAVDATLDAIAECSAPGSTLIATYTPPNLGLGGRPTVHIRAAARLLGEPVRGELSTRALHERLRSRGFDVAGDTGNEEAIERYWGTAWRSHAAGWERVIEAMRRARPS